MKLDPVTLAVMNNRMAAIAEEMGVVLGQTAFSPNIKLRRDHSCALFDSDGNLLAQAAHIPVHLGAMPMAMSVVPIGRLMNGSEKFIAATPPAVAKARARSAGRARAPARPGFGRSARPARAPSADR